MRILRSGSDIKVCNTTCTLLSNSCFNNDPNQVVKLISPIIGRWNIDSYANIC